MHKFIMLPVLITCSLVYCQHGTAITLPNQGDFMLMMQDAHDPLENRATMRPETGLPGGAGRRMAQNTHIAISGE